MDRGESDEEEEEGTPVVTSSQSSEDSEEVAIVINEFMASNATTTTDEGGGTADWIELYNPSDEEVDLGGHFLSDNEDIPTKALLSEGLVIEAGGTLLLWADSDTEQGPLHLPFNLKKAGETILLTSPMGYLLDKVTYENANTDVSFARTPDGVGSLEPCAAPTPGQLNDC